MDAFPAEHVVASPAAAVGLHVDKMNTELQVVLELDEQHQVALAAEARHQAGPVVEHQVGLAEAAGPDEAAGTNEPEAGPAAVPPPEVPSAPAHFRIRS